MAKKDDIPSFNAQLPRAAFIFPKLQTPDTKFKPEGVYEVKVQFRGDRDQHVGKIGKTKATLAEILEKAEEIRDEYVKDLKAKLMAGDPKQKAAAKKLIVKDIGTPTVDDDGDEDGGIEVKAKMNASGTYKQGPKTGQTWNRKPSLFDAKGKPLPKDAPAIWGGSIGKVAVEIRPYYMPKDNEVGISFRLEAVQIIELRSGGGGGDAGTYGFGEEDGYSAEEIGDDAGSQFDDEGGDAGGDEEF